MQVTQPDREILGRRQTEDFPIVPDAGEGDLGVGDGEDLDLLEKIGRLCLFSPEKLPPSGYIKKEIADLDACPGRLPGVLHLVDLTPRDLE